MKSNRSKLVLSNSDALLHVIGQAGGNDGDDGVSRCASFKLPHTALFRQVAERYCGKFGLDGSTVVFKYGSQTLDLDKSVVEQIPLAHRRRGGRDVYAISAPSASNSTSSATECIAAGNIGEASVDNPASGRKTLLLIDFDGVLNASPSHHPYHQTADLIRQLHESNDYDLVILSHNEWAWHALHDWGHLDECFKAMRMVCNHLACQLKDRPYGSRNACLTNNKAELLESLLDNELKNEQYTSIIYFDDSERYLNHVCSKFPDIIPSLVDPNVGLTIEQVKAANLENRATKL